MRSDLPLLMRLLGLPLRGQSVATLLVASVITIGCALSQDLSEGHADASGLGGGAGVHSHVVDGGVADTGSHALATGLNPLCGNHGWCNRRPPDDPEACADVDAGPSMGAGGASPVEADGGKKADSGSAAGGAADAGAGLRGRDGGTDLLDASVRDAKRVLDAGAGGSSGDHRDASDVSDARSDAADAARQSGASFACQVVRDEYGQPVHQCVRAGAGGRNSPCAVSRDCVAGLACVGVQGAGQCLPYCCDVGTRCEDGTFCAERPLLDGTSGEPLAVPVCDKAEACRLDEPYPCKGPDCKCGADTACSIVSSDGLTGCVKPGAGKVGDACPCAAGYFCSQTTASCVKICRTSSSDGACSPGRCQAAAGFPNDFGLCVGSAPSVQ